MDSFPDLLDIWNQTHIGELFEDFVPQCFGVGPHFTAEIFSFCEKEHYKQ